ncbi:MAG TPA: hypothetical protein VK983_05805 [Candidatus Limnocylindrales bacterium]|nr:hypothetical protein [Candidatus Limnocylindrales bacterium]
MSQPEQLPLAGAPVEDFWYAQQGTDGTKRWGSIIDPQTYQELPGPQIDEVRQFGSSLELQVFEVYGGTVVEPVFGSCDKRGEIVSIITGVLLPKEVIGPDWTKLFPNPILDSEE